MEGSCTTVLNSQALNEQNQKRDVLKAQSVLLCISTRLVSFLTHTCKVPSKHCPRLLYYSTNYLTCNVLPAVFCNISTTSSTCQTGPSHYLAGLQWWFHLSVSSMWQMMETFPIKFILLWFIFSPKPCMGVTSTCVEIFTSSYASSPPLRGIMSCLTKLPTSQTYLKALCPASLFKQVTQPSPTTKWYNCAASFWYQASYSRTQVFPGKFS